MSKRTFVIALAAFILGAVASWYMREQVMIDKCLDNGGRWEYQSDLCQKP